MTENPNFSISLANGYVTTKLSENITEVDVSNLLEFDENQIQDLLLTHAAKQAYWEALTVRMSNQVDSFKDEFYEKWWAHNKRFAKLILAAQDEKKPTVDAIKGQTILMYSEERTEQERSRYEEIAFKEALKKTNVFDTSSREAFSREMWRYLLLDTVWYFESLERTLKKLRADHDVIKIVADKLNSRSFHMQNVLHLMEKKMGNVGPMSYTEQNVIRRMNK